MNLIIRIHEYEIIFTKKKKYANATANTRMVGKQIGLLVNSLRSVFYSSDPQDLKVHCIGHSLGSHT